MPAVADAVASDRDAERGRRTAVEETGRGRYAGPTRTPHADRCRRCPATRESAQLLLRRRLEARGQKRRQCEHVLLNPVGRAKEMMTCVACTYALFDIDFDSKIASTLGRFALKGRGSGEEFQMDIELSRRAFLKDTGRGRRRHDARGLRLRRDRSRLRAGHQTFQARQHHGNPQHLPLLLGRVRHHPLFQGRSQERRAGRDHPYRGRLRPSDQSRHAVPEGSGAARLREVRRGCTYPMIRKPGSDKFEPISLGRGARQDRARHEGRSRRELHREEQ